MANEIIYIASGNTRPSMEEEYTIGVFDEIRGGVRERNIIHAKNIIKTITNACKNARKCTRKDRKERTQKNGKTSNEQSKR